MTQQTIRLVCFDLGGVVVRICRTFDDALRRAGLAKQAEQLTLPFTAHDLVDAYQRGTLSGERYANELSAHLGGVLSPADVLAAHDAVILDPYEAVDEIVAHLNSLGLHTAALSNINDRHWPMVRELPAIRQLRHHLLSHEIGAIKPEDATYAAVEQATGCAPENIIFFDDTLENIRAATERGWRAVHIDHAGSTAVQIKRALRNVGITI